MKSAHFHWGIALQSPSSCKNPIFPMKSAHFCWGIAPQSPSSYKKPHFLLKSAHFVLVHHPDSHQTTTPSPPFLPEMSLFCVGASPLNSHQASKNPIYPHFCPPILHLHTVTTCQRTQNFTVYPSHPQKFCLL